MDLRTQERAVTLVAPFIGLLIGFLIKAIVS